MKMQPTKQQIEALKGKCPKCRGFSRFTLKGYPRKNGQLKCDLCQGTSRATIEIEKEWVECFYCNGEGKPKQFQLELKCHKCNGKGKVQKYQVGDEIEIKPNCTQCSKEPMKSIQHSASPQIRYCCMNEKCINFGICYKSFKLKIISETETMQRLIMMR